MTRGFEIFRGTLDRFASRPEIRQAHGGQRIHEVAVRAGDPLRVSVRGRAGVGVTSVIGALGRTMPAGDGPGHVLIPVPIPDADAASLGADVDVVVFAEALKPEDRAVLEGSAAPKVLILNKADLTDPGAARGPWTAAVGRCAQYRAETRVPTLPLSAHVPLADIDDGIVEALKLMVENPADTSSVDAFVTCSHEVPVETRQRLLHELDLYPMGCAIGALRQVPGLAAPGLTSLLRDLSGIDAVVEAIRAAMAQAWYRRMRSVLTELHRIGTTGILPMQVDAFLRGDDLVVAAMRCAVDAATAAGMPVELSDHPEDHRYRAERWQRFAAGPVNATFAAVGTDIVRGSLRLWRLAGGPRMNALTDKRVDELVLAVDPALGPLGVDLQDTVMVTGGWLAGASTLAAELASRMSGVRVVEPEDLRHGQAPGVVVFVCSGTAPLTPSDCGLIQLAAANTDALIAVVSKIDVHQSWREVMDRNREILAQHDSRFRGITWLGVSTRGAAPGLDELVRAVGKAREEPGRDERNRLRAWATRLQGMLNVPPELGEGARADELRNQRQAAVRRTRSSKSERTLALRNRIAQARMTLLYFARKRVGSVGGELREDIAELKRRDVAGFGDRVRRRIAEVVAEVEQGTEEHLAEVSAEVNQHWVAPRPSTNRPVPPQVGDPSVRSRRLETRMMALFGIFFGLGAALTVSRLVAYARPGLALVGLAVGLVAGACIAVWLVAVRGLLHDRTVLDRWLGDTMSELRGYLEQWVGARVLEVETRLNADLVEIDERENDKLAARVGKIDSELREAAMNTARATALRNRDLPAVQKALTKVTERLDAMGRSADNKL